MNNVFTINGKHFKENCLPDLNNLLSEATKHPMAYARMKKGMEQIVIASARRDLGGYKPIKCCQLNIVWGEKKKGNKRDFDNVVSAGRKIINDALVKMDVLVDDSPKYLMYGKNKFVYTDEPFIRVEIEEL